MGVLPPPTPVPFPVGVRDQGFKPCGTCHSPMPMGDPHDFCRKCLGEAHQTDCCKICRRFCPRTKKEMDFRLKQLLMETALHPQPASGQQDLALSTSLWSAPASIERLPRGRTLGTETLGTDTPWRQSPQRQHGTACAHWCCIGGTRGQSACPW